MKYMYSARQIINAVEAKQIRCSHAENQYHKNIYIASKLDSNEKRTIKVNNELSLYLLLRLFVKWNSVLVSTRINPLHNVPETGTHAMDFQWGYWVYDLFHNA